MLILIFNNIEKRSMSYSFVRFLTLTERVEPVEAKTWQREARWEDGRWTGNQWRRCASPVNLGCDVTVRHRAPQVTYTTLPAANTLTTVTIHKRQTKRKHVFCPGSLSSISQPFFFLAECSSWQSPRSVFGNLWIVGLKHPCVARKYC